MAGLADTGDLPFGLAGGRWPVRRSASRELVAGITLARYGISVLVIDKRDGVPALSRALVISTRGMELMRRWGLRMLCARGHRMSSRAPG